MNASQRNMKKNLKGNIHKNMHGDENIIDDINNNLKKIATISDIERWTLTSERLFLQLIAKTTCNPPSPISMLL